MHRLFFALWPDDALRSEIQTVARCHQAQHPAGRAVRADRYHMTLQFLGDFAALSEPMHASLLAAAKAIQRPEPFELLLDRVGSFGAGRVLWLGCSVPPPPLVQLHRDLGEALASAGIAMKPEAEFVPHVTLLRNARSPNEGPTAPLRWKVPAFVLVDSTAGDYRMLGRWPLRNPDVKRGSRIPASR